jgi:predicted double-glycine peptidase
MKKARYLVLLVVLLAGSDKPQKTRQPIPIPGGAIKIPLPHVEQPDEVSCGAACMMSICSFYGVGPQTIAEFKKHLHTDENGTRYTQFREYAEELELQASIAHAKSNPPMTLERLVEYLQQGKPVICSIQAYADKTKVYDDPEWNKDGHYVVVVGFDETNLYFMDPSINWRHPHSHPRRTFLAKDDFVKRWHDNEGTDDRPELIKNLGVVISPKTEGTPFLRRAWWLE